MTAVTTGTNVMTSASNPAETKFSDPMKSIGAIPIRRTPMGRAPAPGLPVYDGLPDRAVPHDGNRCEQDSKDDDGKRRQRPDSSPGQAPSKRCGTQGRDRSRVHSFKLNPADVSKKPLKPRIERADEAGSKLLSGGCGGDPLLSLPTPLWRIMKRPPLGGLFSMEPPRDPLGC